MSDMKCPFCQRKLKTFAKYKDGTSTVYCSKCILIGDSKLFSELIRTRKALDVAKDTLCWYDDNYDSVVARNTLDEIKTITAPEEKDVK